ncbi:MAG TPA: hypothetical protein VNF70_08875, partial [Pyrinomonadaceae bacterium]|nr:hypothetical protein [Pyrinomonadaceae bacterium]
MDENALICPPAIEEAFKLPLPLREGKREGSGGRYFALTELFSLEEEKMNFLRFFICVIFIALIAAIGLAQDPNAKHFEK